MDPINYSLDVQSPMQAVAQGYQLGAGIRDDQAKQVALEQQRTQAQQQATVLRALIANPNAGAKDYADATLLVPGMREQLKQAWDTRNTDQQASHLSDVAQYFAAVKNGQPQLAADMMTQRADAMEKAGASPREVQSLRVQAQVVQEHPEFARSMMGMLLASLPGGDKIISGATTLGAEQRAEANAPAEAATKTAEARIKTVQAKLEPERLGTEIANVKDQIAERTRRFNLDSDKLTSDVQLELEKLKQKNGELPEFVAKDVGAAVTESLSAQQSAARMTTLADQITQAAADLPSGAEAKVAEAWKKAFGTQNELSRIRAEYNRIVTPAAMAAYKQVASGSTSDKDIETAMTGVPKDTDSPERMAEFLRGAAKLQMYDSAMSGAKSEWLGAVRNLGKAPRDITIDGVQVPAGTTFREYVDQVVGPKVNAASVATRPYMRYATPQQPGAAATGGASGGF